MALVVPRRWRAGLLALLAACAMTGWVARIDPIPAGPDAHEPGFGVSADWDLQWSASVASEAASAAGELPGWDPFPDYGTPVLANPEVFVAHPAYVVGSRWGAVSGLRALHAVSVLILVLGFAWLASELGVPWWLGLPGAAAVLASFEWEARIYSGHLMFLGTSAWPGALAAITRGLRTGETVRWGSVGGALLGLATLGGAHYPAVFAGALCGLWAWSSVVSARAALALLAVAALALQPWGPGWLQWGVSGIGAVILIGGAWARDARAPLLGLLGGGLLGLLAAAGARLIPGVLLGGAVGRIDVHDIGRTYAATALDLLLRFDGQIEGPLRLPGAWVGWGALVCLALLWRVERARPLAVTALALTGAAWSAGLPGSPWPLLHALPGMTGINYPLRLQWVLLYLAPLGAVLLLWEGAERWGARSRVATIATVVLTGALLTAAPMEDRVDGARPASLAPAPMRVTGVTAAESSPDLLSRAGRDGLIRAGRATAIGFGPPGAPPPLDGVAIRRGTIEVTADRGAQLEVPQRAMPGWRCDGASLGAADPNRFLRLTMTEDRARCRYRTPGLVLGLVLQALAVVALVGLWWRRR